MRREIEEAKWKLQSLSKAAKNKIVKARAQEHQQELWEVKREKQEYETIHAEMSGRASFFQWATYVLAAALMFAVTCAIIWKSANPS